MDDDFTVSLKNDRCSIPDLHIPEFVERNSRSDEEENFTDLHRCSIDDLNDRSILIITDDLSTEQHSSQNPSLLNFGEKSENIFVGSSLKSYESMFALVNENPIRFFLSTIPKDFSELVRFRLLRDSTSAMPMFHFQMEFDDGNKFIRLLTAKKQMKVFTGCQYNISLSSETNTNLPFAELFCENIAGRNYILKYLNSKEDQGIALIQYASNFCGLSGPRKFHVFIPKTSVPVKSLQDFPNVFDNSLSVGNEKLFYHLENKAPRWDEDRQSYTLKFNGETRVAIPSLKNFQLLFQNQTGDEVVVMQHGRMKDYSLSCDFCYPLSILQAFAISLSSIESFLLRE